MTPHIDGPIRAEPSRRVSGVTRPPVTPYVTLLLIGLVLTTASAIHAQQLPVRIYTTADGLAHDHVRRIVLDSRGFLWFCTMQGLNRFDGQRFIEYSTRDGLGSASVYDLLEATRQASSFAPDRRRNATCLPQEGSAGEIGRTSPLNR